MGSTDDLANKTHGKKVTYNHPNPFKWWKLIKLITSIFIRGGEFQREKHNGGEFSTSFLKYVYRTLFKFPIPAMGTRPPPNNTDKNWYFNKIQCGINFVRNEIQPYFKNRYVGQQTPKPVSKTKLTELWKSNKRRAIEIVTQDDMDCPQSYCPLSKGDVTQFYTNKSRRIIGEWNPDLAPCSPTAADN